MVRSSLLAVASLALLTAIDPASLSAAADIPPQAVPAAVQAHALEVERAEDGLFYVHAVVNGAPVRFLVDTGANYTVLTESDAARVGLARGARYDASVETVGGKTAMAWTTLAEVRVAGRAVKDLRAAVVRDGLPVSLLGQNMLAHLDQVTIERDRLRLR